MAEKTNKSVFVYAATYASLADANADYAAVKKLYFDGLIGVYDAAVIGKDATGQVKIHKTEMPTQYGDGADWRWEPWSESSFHQPWCGNSLPARRPAL